MLERWRRGKLFDNPFDDDASLYRYVICLIQKLKINLQQINNALCISLITNDNNYDRMIRHDFFIRASPTPLIPN